jgi:hypothetical protein
MVRWAEIAKHHSAIFSKFLTDYNLPSPMTIKAGIIINDPCLFLVCGINGG